MESSFQNDSLGCNAVSWAPYSTTLSHNEDGSITHRLATASCDNAVRIWSRTQARDGSGIDADGKWVEEEKNCAKSPHTGEI